MSHDPYFPDPYASMTDDEDLHARMEHAAQALLMKESEERAEKARQRAAEWAATELEHLRPLEDQAPAKFQFAAE